MNQFKSLVLAGIAAGATIYATSATAENTEWFFKPYVGADIERLGVDYKASGGIDYSEIYEDSFMNYNLHVGARIHKHMGIELGYSKSSEENKDLGSTTVGGLGVAGDMDVKFSGFNFDVLGYYPLNKDETLELIGSAGLARWKADAKLNVTAGTTSDSFKDDTSDTMLRAGVGAQYHFSDNLSTRGMLRYMSADFEDTVDNAISFGIGLNYRF